jgi:hypothetical protein
MGNNIDLETACKQGDLETVKRIVETPEKWYDGKLSLDDPLVLASKNNHLEIARYLCKKIKERGELYIDLGKSFYPIGLVRA